MRWLSAPFLDFPPGVPSPVQTALQAELVASNTRDGLTMTPPPAAQALPKSLHDEVFRVGVPQFEVMLGAIPE